MTGPTKSCMPAVAIGLALCLGQAPTSQPTLAQDNAAAAPSAKADELTPEEKVEREGRKACKVQICAAFRTRKPGPDIACNVVKTWRKEHIDKLISKAKVSWPWGQVQCVADIKLKRNELIKAMTESKHTASLDRHQVVCTVAREKDTATIKFDFAPKITFEASKAVKAQLNWGTIEAPTLVKGAMWTATATDNAFNVLQGTIVDDVNDFVSAKCDEVKEEWTAK